jgi:hypothetical protein
MFTVISFYPGEAGRPHIFVSLSDMIISNCRTAFGQLQGAQHTFWEDARRGREDVTASPWREQMRTNDRTGTDRSLFRHAERPPQLRGSL